MTLVKTMLERFHSVGTHTVSLAACLSRAMSTSCSRFETRFGRKTLEPLRMSSMPRMVKQNPMRPYVRAWASALPDVRGRDAFHSRV